MAYKRLDISEDEVYEGFSFVDEDGTEYFCNMPEQLLSGNATVAFGIGGNDCLDIYKHDIPLMIKILQAAYDAENMI